MQTDELDEELEDDDATDAEEEADDLAEEEAPARSPRRSARRRRLARPRAKTVNLKADFTLPVERLARLAEEEFDDSFDGDDDNGVVEHLARSVQPGVNPFAPGAGSADAYLREIQEATRIKAYVHRVPATYAIRNPLLSRKPVHTPGWASLGSMGFDPETIDDDLQTAYGDGHYFVEIKEHGKFKAGMLKTIGDPQRLHEVPAQPIAPAFVHEPAQPQPNPMADAKASAYAMNSVVEAATRLLQAQQQPAPAAVKPPSLKERLEEMRLMQEMFAPKQAVSSNGDPLERLAAALESESVKRVIASIKSDNPAGPSEPSTSFWDFAAEAAEFLAPGLNPLLAGLGKWIGTQAFATQPPQPSSPPARQPRPELPEPNPPAPKEEEEETGVNLQFLLEDLFNQAPVEKTAATITEMLGRAPMAKRVIRRYLALPNDQLIESFLDLCETDEEADALRKSFAACEWRNEWLDKLKAHLNGGSNAQSGPQS